MTITSESRRGNAAATPAAMKADEVTGTFGAGSVLRTISGAGHAEIDQMTATGTRQTANGDRLEAQFAQSRDQETKGPRDQEDKADKSRKSGDGVMGATEVQSAEIDGNVVLFEQPATKPGAQAQPPLRATAGKAVYEGQGEWLHLTMSPRVVNGGMELTAEKVDVSQQSGDAWARGDVKATWNSTSAGGQSAAGSGDTGPNGLMQGGVTLGGKGPAHVVATEAQLDQSTGEATFHGHARLWQETNFVSGPEIVLDQRLHTLMARSSDPAEPVRAVMLSASGGKNTAQPAGQSSGKAPGQTGENNAGTQPVPSVIRVHGGDLKYSDFDRRAVMHGGALGAVIAETGTATSASDEVELDLMPAGNQSGSGTGGGAAQVDRMIATGHVVLTLEGRRGIGERLVYSGASGDYVLTGTATTPPKMSDPEHGTVTGEALIFYSRDDRDQYRRRRPRDRNGNDPLRTRTESKAEFASARRMETLIAEGIGKSYKRRQVVRDVNLRISRGEVVGLLGPNGAGKTTSFYMIVGLVQPETGRVLVDETDITRVPMYLRARNFGISYLPQEPSVFRKLTAEENILAVLEAQPLGNRERRTRAEKLINQLNLGHIRTTRGYALSGGERRRVEIARALCIQPNFILLDEPFSGIDPIAVLELQKIIFDLKASGIGVLVTDHNVRETLTVTDRAYIITEGRIFRTGTPRELGNDPEVRRIYLGEKFSLE